MRIYISSTSEDLVDYRLAVINGLQLSGHKPVCMEYHPAGDRTPKDDCLKEVAFCEAYIGIFAWRYGFIPPQCEISITELEYREALRCGIPTLIFLLDKNVDWPEKLKEKGLNGDLINRLRNELQLTKWVRYFHDPSNLTTEVLAAVSVVTMGAAFYYAKQTTLNDLEIRDNEFKKLKEEQIRVDIRRNQKKPNRVPIPIPERLIRHFQDRDSELMKLKNYLSNKNLKMVLICGRGGMGKTTLIVKLLQELIEDFEGISQSITGTVDSIVFVPLGEKGYRTPDRIVELISRTLEPEEAKELIEVWNQEYTSIKERLAELFRGPLLHRRCIIILDNLESVLDEENRIISELEGLRSFVDVFLEYDHASVMIVTSRRTLTLSHEAEIAAIGRRGQIPLDEGLPEGFAIELLKELDIDGNLGLRDAAPEVLRGIVCRCGYIPRTLETLAATLLQRPTWTLKTLLESKDYLSRLIENPARELFSSLPSDQQRLVVQTLSIYDKPVPSVAIRTILPALPVDKILDELYRNFVVSHDRGQFWLHPLDKEYAYNQIPDGQTGFSKSELNLGAAEFYKQLHKPTDSWKGIEDIEPQLQEFRHLIRAQHFDDACKVFNEIDREYLSTWGYHQQIIESRLLLVDNIKNHDLSGWNLGHLGSAYMDSGHPDRAKIYYEKALIIALETNDRQLECRVLGNLGRVEGSLGNRKKESALLTKALNIAYEINDPLHKGRWLGNLTGVNYDLGLIDVREAISNYNKALSNAEEINDWRFKMIWSECLGNIYIRMNDLENAVPFLKGALFISKNINSRWQTYYNLTSLGHVYSLLGNRKQELECYKQILEIIKEIGNYYYQFNVLLWLSEKYAGMMLNTEQLKCNEEIHRILNGVTDLSIKRDLLLYLGDQYQEYNYKDKSVELYIQALNIAQELRNNTELFLTALRIAKCYSSMRKYLKAIEYYELGLKTARETVNRPGEATVLKEYANLLLITGDAIKSIKHYELALSLVEEMHDKSSQMNILNRIGMGYSFLNKMLESKEYYEKYLEVAQEIRSRESEAIALFNIGDACHQLGDIKSAITFYEKSLILNSEVTNYKCMIGLGICCFHAGKLLEGKSYFEHSIQLLKPYNSNPNMDNPQTALLGLSLLAVGKTKEAITLYSKGLKNTPPKEQICYAIQDLLMLEQVPQKIDGLSEILNLLRESFERNLSP